MQVVGVQCKMKRQHRGYILTVLMLSVCSHTMHVVSHMSQAWVVAKAKPGDVTISYGLYQGFMVGTSRNTTQESVILTLTCLLYLNVCAWTCQTTDSLRTEQIIILYDSGRLLYPCIMDQKLQSLPPARVRESFIDASVWLATVLSAVLSYLTTLVALTLTAYNVKHTPSNHWLSIHSLYFWFGTSCVFSLLAIASWGLEFFFKLVKNVGTVDTIAGLLSSNEEVHLCYSFWIQLAVVGLHCCCMALLHYRDTLFDKRPPFIGSLQKLNKFTDTMGDVTAVANPDVNQDDLIIQQQRNLEKEISEKISLVGEKENLMSLESEYIADDIYRQKVHDLASKYKSIRRTRPDGNCFFRGFGFAYFERLLDKPEEYKSFRELALKSKDSLIALGFPQFTLEDFHDTFMEVIELVSKGPQSYEALHNMFNDQGYSDYVVVYLRLIASGHLQKEADFYQNFIEGDRTIKDFCSQEVEPMFKESDHIHIIALASALNVGVRVRYMDRGNTPEVIAHDFPEGSIPAIHLLYRPGHYDILYPG